jgi:acyl-coA dehydrogenase domain protein
MFEGHTVFKKFGEAGLLGITRDPKYNGLGLDYSYSLAFFEALGSTIGIGGFISGLLVQTDMATPALARFGSEELKQKFLVPTIAGDYVACVGITEPSGGSDVAGRVYLCSSIFIPIFNF